MKQIFDISLWSLDRRERKMLRLQRDRHRISHDFLNDLEMDCRITDYALLADLFPAGFELRFDQTDDLSILCQKISYRKH